MWVMEQIVSWLNSASSFFYDAYVEMYRAYYIPSKVADVFYELGYVFNRLAWYSSDFFSWLLTQIARLDDILSYTQIQIYFMSYFDAAMEAWLWVYYSVTNVTNIVNNWWSTTYLTVQGWIDEAKQTIQSQVDVISNNLNSLQSLWDDFATRVPSIDSALSWFSNWWVNILVHLEPWWNEKLLGVSTLIDSTLTVWFPFYNNLTLLWGDIELFFTDPEDWLYKAVDRIVERFW